MDQPTNQPTERQTKQTYTNNQVINVKEHTACREGNFVAILSTIFFFIVPYSNIPLLFLFGVS